MKGLNIRRFEAASINRTLSEWITAQLDSFDEEIRQDIKTLRSRSRDASINDPYARRYFKSIVQNVVGPHGIQLKMAIRNAKGNPDTFANLIIEERWNRFTRSVTVDGLNLRETLNMFLETIARDGEIFAVIKRGDAYGRHKIAIQLFEAEYVDTDFTAILKNGNQVISGIEYDPQGRRVAYHFWKEHPTTSTKLNRDNARIRIPAADVLHGFNRERASQGRGYPWLSAALVHLKHIKEAEKSELVATRVASAKMGFYTRPAGDPSLLAGADDPTDPQATITEVEAGVLDVLPEGYDFKTFDPQHPNGNFPAFKQAVLRAVAASVGISYNRLAADLESTSYGSLRAGDLWERDTFMELQQFLIDRLLTPLFEAWLENMLAFQLDNVRLPLEGYDKFNAPTWRPRTWGYLDPTKETTAIKMQLEQRVRSRTDVARQMGRDYVDVLAEIAAEEAKAKEFGVNLMDIDGQLNINVVEEQDIDEDEPKREED